MFLYPFTEKDRAVVGIPRLNVTIRKKLSDLEVFARSQDFIPPSFFAAEQVIGFKKWCGRMIEGETGRLFTAERRG